jgi:hypothetical protein
MMANDLNSPLSGRVTSNFGGVGRHKSKIIFGTAVIALVPMLLSTFAASVTVGNGNLEFGQGSQQAVACDENVFVALGEEWHGAPTPQDSSAGYFRVRTVTVSNLDVESCAGKRLRVRLVDGTSAELQIGSVPGATVFQVAIPDSAPTSNITDSVALGLTYLTGTGQLISGAMAATAVLNVSGTSVYDGSSLTAQSADVTFYVDASATQVNIDGQLVRRATVETVAASSSAQ